MQKLSLRKILTGILERFFFGNIILCFFPSLAPYPAWIELAVIWSIMMLFCSAISFAIETTFDNHPYLNLFVEPVIVSFIVILAGFMIIEMIPPMDSPLILHSILLLLYASIIFAILFAKNLEHITSIQRRKKIS